MMVHPLSLVLLFMIPPQLSTYYWHYTTDYPTTTSSPSHTAYAQLPTYGWYWDNSATTSSPSHTAYATFTPSTHDVNTRTTAAQLPTYGWYWDNSATTSSPSHTAYDGPKRVEVFSGSFGGIIEGGSVTLTCRSDANPPVESYTWFKRSGTEDLKIGTRQSYRIRIISIEDNYKYKCRASNRHGSAFSEYTPLDILYSPKNTSVSVTLTCKADANPPVMDYTWYKEGESAPVAYGQTYSIASITKEDIAPFYCKTGNKIGHHFARPVPVTCIEECPKGKVTAAGIGGFCGGLAAAVLLNILWISWRKNKTTSGSEYGVGESRRKKQKKTAIEDDYENVGPDTKDDDTYTALNMKTKPSDDVYEALTTESSPPCAVTQV
ncbi:B-cell receptor CD22-like [Colossoma macropomum]|uniref:B-cell receptor CD22-like n=1 Tax=Colossoma macropomum TaxID=42526 RepID=UPI001863BC7B|nr:B-cell receptor CD22-like [Colossoma macropomum]